LGREPLCEQEVIAVAVAGHPKLGIDKILRIRTRFPDMLVKLRGKAEPVHLEVEVYSSSFDAHGHANQVWGGKFREDRRSVAVLCWVDDADDRLRRRVHDVYELQTLIRDNSKIKW